MEPEINFTPQDLDEQPLAYFPDGDPAARIGLTMSFYFGAPGRVERRRALVHLIGQYLHQAQGQLRTYALLRDRTYRPFPPHDKIFELGARMTSVPQEEPFSFEASGAEREGISHSWSIAAFADDVERATELGFLLVTYPLTILEGAPPRIFTQQFVSFCNKLQVEHAYGGFGLILPFDVGGRRAARQVVGEVAMRFPGLDVDDLTGVSIHCEQGIKSVNFLTAVSDRLLAKVGGAQAVATQAGAGIEVHRYDTGAVFQAGPVPQIGDTTRGFLPDRYVALGRALKPLRAPYPNALVYDPTGKDNKAFTQRWLARFDGEGS